MITNPETARKVLVGVRSAVRKMAALLGGGRLLLAGAPRGEPLPTRLIVDSHAAELQSGDSVTLIKDITRAEDPELIEDRVSGTVIYLLTEFLTDA